LVLFSTTSTGKWICVAVARSAQLRAPISK
jgi:hypothetical protein